MVSLAVLLHRSLQCFGYPGHVVWGSDFDAGELAERARRGEIEMELSEPLSS